jgi:hypothetical protein
VGFSLRAMWLLPRQGRGLQVAVALICILFIPPEDEQFPLLDHWSHSPPYLLLSLLCVSFGTW